MKVTTYIQFLNNNWAINEKDLKEKFKSKFPELTDNEVELWILKWKEEGGN